MGEQRVVDRIVAAIGPSGQCHVAPQAPIVENGGFISGSVPESTGIPK